ncbi:hypothetical protein J7E71_25620 [Mesobacillus foraminis]|uniref:nuclease domain-containing protein n=1 Tax=Mesobacillus foraminis TaxID=279826 RepID=UPI001BED3405|nr:DUF2357 domain-containing protein [Mesobacillus foraminis]MBT2759255.1 hypothetical protein [Mesobacillus foraminis]
MEPHNSGDKDLEIYDNQQGWIPFQEAYLTEATEYKLRYRGEFADIRIQDIPLPFYQQESSLYSTFHAPFQSGTLRLYVNGKEFQNYVYPDDRKLTKEQYDQMVGEILEEAGICFQISGLEGIVNTSGRGRSLSWTQWTYIDEAFFQLRLIFSRLQQQSVRRLEKQRVMMKRPKVHRDEQVTLMWLDRKGFGHDVPINVENTHTYETRNVYENQVVKQQILDLKRLLGKYHLAGDERISEKAKKYSVILQGWLITPFLQEVTANNGAYTITQIFRKHPVYRLWHQWFDKLYKHEREDIGLDYPIALKDTFFLYEMWCFMMIVKILREAGLILETRSLYRTNKEGLYLNLAENKESRISLIGNLSLYFQRSYQYNSKVFHTFTQRMIPDIVIEGEAGILILDPKYRVPDNLGTALGEMHKYRDGILHRETGTKRVRQVFILTPTKTDQADSLRYFQDTFHERYQMGAIQMLPGTTFENVKRKILACIELIMD